jgi:serine/threonine protein kinase
LKPENLLLVKKNVDQIKVIDFGTSKVFDPNKKMSEKYGTVSLF